MKNILKNNFIIDASVELVPRISISPFSNVNSNLNETSELNAINYFNTRFGKYRIFPKARNAIYAALNTIELKSDDVVTIFTTSGNFYISSCVTKEIEKKCCWSRVFSNKTKVLFVNHEFGYPMSEEDYKDITELKKKNPDLLLIEDCAHTFFTENSIIGRNADYIIYSLPKSFQMQIGALLVSNKEISDLCVCDFQYDVESYNAYISKKFSEFIPNIDKYRERQLDNYEYLKKKLADLGISPFFDKANVNIHGTIPNVFLFCWKDNIDYPKLKEFMQNNGVESSVFYGKNAFFIPCNYNLSKDDLDYMICLLSCFEEM